MSDLGSNLPPSSSSNKGLRHRLRILFVWTGGLSLLVFLALTVLWLDGTLENRFQVWLQKKVIAKLVRDLQPKVPFSIETIEIDAPWAELKKGKIAALRLVLKFPKENATGDSEWRLRALGAIQVRSSPQAEWIVQYDPVLTLESRLNHPSTPLPVHLLTTFSPRFTELIDFELKTQAEKFHWKDLGIELARPQLVLHWKTSNPSFDFNFNSEVITWNQKSTVGTRTIHAEKTGIQIQSPLTLSPLRFGPQVRTQLHSHTLEVLWDETYVDFPIREFPLRATIEFDSDSSFEIDKLSLDFPTLQLFVKKSGDHIRTQWKSSSLAIEKTQAQFGSILPGGLAQLQVRHGTLRTQGQAEFTAGFKALHSASGTVSGEKIWLLFRDAAAEIKQGSFKIPFSFRAVRGSETGELKIPEGWLQADEGYFRHFKARLGRTPFSFDNQEKASVFQFKTPSALPLTIEGIPLTIGQVRGHWNAQKNSASASKVPTFEIKAPLTAKKVELSHVTRGFCSKGSPPPAQISFEFKPAVFADDNIELNGQVHADIFGGKLLVNEIAFYDLGSEVPQSNFSVNWSGLRLEDFGRHHGFGEMAGLIQGHAKEVVFQSWLPTHYDFRFEVKPERGSDIVFSPDAMKNVIKLFAGEDIDHLPGVANWLAFGWPSRLFGGFDIDYFGISAYSAEGAILLETLDPPEVFARERQHFILYGKRFKMPLNSARYPLVVDATSMSNFVRHMVKQFDTIAKEKEKKESRDEKDDPCLPPGLAGVASQ